MMRKSFFYTSSFKNKRRRTQLKLLLLFAACFFLSLEIGWMTQKNRSVLYVDEESDIVLSAELAGYLQIIPFSPDETRAWLLPSMGTCLTGADIDRVLSFLELDTFSETVHTSIPYEDEEEITRQKWCLIYERLLEYLGVSDEVNVISLRYLGMVPGESRLMADSGNYDCDAESIHFTYGETYEVYICGNTLLGTKTDTGESQVQSENAAQEELDELSDEIAIPETVRVLLTQDNHQSAYRTTVSLKGSTALRISAGEMTYEADADVSVDCTDLMTQWNAAELTITAGDGGRICITNTEGSTVSSYYRGSMHVYKNDNGFWIVNEPDLEEYLYGVVPGEMPESFAQEALKTQAVCARTYVCRKAAAGNYADFQADVNDTTDCQVYLPSKENEAAIQAVDATAGQVLTYQGRLAAVYYFSTSCGFTSGPEVWQSETTDYLTGVSLLTEKQDISDFDSFLRDTGILAYDSESRYFRWTAELSPASAQENLKQAISDELNKNSGRLTATDTDGTVITDTGLLGDYETMTVVQRNASGTATDLLIQFTGGSVHLYHENVIRTILGSVMTSLTDKNGDLVYTISILPGAAVSVDSLADGSCSIYGGGLGHGIGMSQYGANGMAEAGKSFEEILQMFFPGTEVITRP